MYFLTAYWLYGLATSANENSRPRRLRHSNGGWVESNQEDTNRKCILLGSGTDIRTRIPGKCTTQPFLCESDDCELYKKANTTPSFSAMF